MKRLDLFVSALVLLAQLSYGQGMTLGDIVIVNYPELKEGVSARDFRSYVEKDIIRVYNKPNTGINFHLFQADRGKNNGGLMLVCALNRLEQRTAIKGDSPFTDNVLATRNGGKPSDVMKNPQSYTEYHMIGPKNSTMLPKVEILGIHYIKVNKERAKEFENFVISKMHPAVANLLPDMKLLTYKAVDKDHKGDYITIFAINSVDSRDQYWPAGKPETATLKEAFRPLGHISAELKDYLVPGSYLEPSGGAAAIFESKEWTDYVLQTSANN